MVDEPKTKKEQEALSLLQQARQEKEELTKIRDEVAVQIKELKELKAVEVMSGKTDKAEPEEKKEVSPLDYANLALQGKIDEK